MLTNGRNVVCVSSRQYSPAMSFAHLATVEVQQIMPYCDGRSLLSLSRCSRFTLACASSSASSVSQSTDVARAPSHLHDRGSPVPELPVQEQQQEQQMGLPESEKTTGRNTAIIADTMNRGTVDVGGRQISSSFSEVLRAKITTSAVLQQHFLIILERLRARSLDEKMSQIHFFTNNSDSRILSQVYGRGQDA
jgi:hypothetical protein